MKKVRYKRELTHDEKSSMVVAVIMIIATIPVLFGFASAGIIDHFDVKALRDAGDPMAYVWVLSAMTVLMIGVVSTGYIALFIMKKWPRMREAFPAIWEDDEEEPLPETESRFFYNPDAKPVPQIWKERQEKFTRGYICFVLVIVGWIGGIICMASWDSIQDWLSITEQDIEQGTMLYYKGEFYHAIIIIITFAVMMYAMYRLLTSSVMSSFKQFIPDPIDTTDRINPYETVADEYKDTTEQTSSDQGVEKK